MTPVSFRENHGAAFARFIGLACAGSKWCPAAPFAPDDIIVLVDMDDYLAHPNVLERVAEEYEAGADCSYGSYKFHGGGKWHQESYPVGCNYRTHPWRCSPLRTFRYELFEPRPERFIMDGEWIRKATDVALMVPILERAKKPVFIDETLYIYRHNLPSASRKVVSKEYKERVMQWLMAA